jgi:GNAT superfamily N-acetyltransferase
MIVKHTNIYRLADYSKHLKNLESHDKLSRFGNIVNDFSIDQMILRMVYNPSIHELWYAKKNDEIVGWGHMADNNDSTWELAVSVEHEYQKQGIGDKLIEAMLAWAKFHKIDEVFMHCIEENHVIQHLARKHNLKTRERFPGEQTASIELPEPTIFETNTQLWREQSEIFAEFTKLRNRLMELWTMPLVSKYVDK